MQLTEKEKDLIETLRHYRRSFPNGYPDLLDYAQQIFYELADPYADPFNK